MSQKANERTLFHLVPETDNKAAQDALEQSDNKRFVSLSAEGTLGLEIGFHVPPISRGHVITKLGRNTDLMLRDSYSGVHVAFEIHPETLVVMLSIRTKHISSVTIAPIEDSGEVGEHIRTDTKTQPITGDCALLYGEDYFLTIASYEFRLLWRRGVNGRPARVKFLKDLAIRDYRDAQQRLKYVRSRDLSMAVDSNANSWYMTRLQSTKQPLVTELAAANREYVGEGGFGIVYRTIDRASGNYFAVKVVNLAGKAAAEAEAARTALHREVKIIQMLTHDHIIGCLGTADFHTYKPLIFMPLREGSLHSLVRGTTATDELCHQVLHQMLQALDYLAFQNYCHRDVKPLNILYQTLGQDLYRFELADFGFAKHFKHAKTFCGTELYLAPELYNSEPQTPKMDIWSLFVTMAQIHPGYAFPPKTLNGPQDLLRAVQKVAAEGSAKLRPMARIKPALRASAAQMLVAYFDSQGLTTPENQTPPIEPETVPEPAATPLVTQPAPAPIGVIVYPPNRHRRQARPTPAPGILQNRPQPPQYGPAQPPVLAHNDGVRKPTAKTARPREAPRPVETQKVHKAKQDKGLPAPQARPVRVEPGADKLPPQEKGSKLGPHAQLPGNQRHSPYKAADANEVPTPRLPGMFPTP